MRCPSRLQPKSRFPIEIIVFDPIDCKSSLLFIQEEILTIIHFLKVEQRLPWGVIFLLGAGFSLADITKRSGLSQFLVEKLDVLKV